MSRRVTEKTVQPKIDLANYRHIASNDPRLWTINALSDGTNTVVEIQDRSHGEIRIVGRGLSRRRPGDPRNEELGNALAYARAFASAANYAARYAAHLSGEVPLSTDAAMLRDFAKFGVAAEKQEKKAKKDARRAAARHAYETANGGPWKADK